MLRLNLQDAQIESINAKIESRDAKIESRDAKIESMVLFLNPLNFSPKSLCIKYGIFWNDARIESL